MIENLAIAAWRRNGARESIAPVSFASLVRLANEFLGRNRRKSKTLEEFHGGL